MDNKILHIEDNPDDITLTALAFRKAGVKVPLEVASDAERAMGLLKDSVFASSLVCVLMDVKLPSMSGLEVLGWVRAQPTLKRLPVIMLTSSLLPNDINRAYDLGANSYLVKPADLESLVVLARTIDQYWIQTNTRPVG